MKLPTGEPIWTDGHFDRASARDDLGIEDLGASLLREMIPGVGETSISAAYYSYYAFLVSEFAREYPDELHRGEFQRFYRRQEVALSVGCSRHDLRHRSLRGINGIDRCGDQARHAGPDGLVDLASLAAPQVYMRTGLGGYGLFYRNVLEGIGLVRLGAGTTSVDRVTALGEAAAEGVREVMYGTDYWKEFRFSDKVPMRVLSDLADVLCPCLLPDRPDHNAVVRAFFHDQGQSERWSQARSYRAMSLSLMMEFHEQRPDASNDITSWRMALISGRIGDVTWETSFPRHRDAWRAYQNRETMVAALGVVWCSFLDELGKYDMAFRHEVRDVLVAATNWEMIGVDPASSFQSVTDQAAARFSSKPEDMILMANDAMARRSSGELGEAVGSALVLLGTVALKAPGDQDFQTLLEAGGDERLSYDHVHRWLDERRKQPVATVLSELVDKLVFRHLQIANGKLTPTDKRDPFCVDEDEAGRLRVVRDDAPFWTGARWSTLNHLLWTIGAIDSPDGDARLTDLGHDLLSEARAGV